MSTTIGDNGTAQYSVYYFLVIIVQGCVSFVVILVRDLSKQFFMSVIQLKRLSLPIEF